MTSPTDITTDDLLGLIAGTLNPDDFSRVAAAVKREPALQAQLASLEHLRHRLVQAMDLAPSPIQAQAMATNVLARIALNPAPPATPASPESWAQRLRHFFSASPPPARWAYALVLVQALGMTWLASGALQPADPSAADTRSTNADSKQLGEVPGNVIISVSFDAATPESAVRGLLLDIEAQIIAGPTQLGQYKISVARNRRDLALTKLKEASFVAQLIETEAPPGQSGEKSGGNK